MIEQEGLLKNYWYAAGTSSEVNGNKPTKRIIFNIPIVLWRASDNKLSALLDRCAHRNAPLSEGRVKDCEIVCPYHGWTFNQNGQCSNIPSEGPHKERIPKHKIEKFPTLEQNGLIWVWMGRDISPDKQPFPMPLKNTKGWKNYYMITRFSNNVTNLVENFMDVPHTIYVHKGWFRDRKQMKVPMYVERTEDSVLVSYDQNNDSISAFDWMINPKGLPMQHTDKFFMPNVTRVDYTFGEEEKAFIITSTCTPVSPYESIVYTLISYKFGWFNLFAKLFLPWYTRKVINQDVEIMQIQGKNIKHFKETKFKSTQADLLHIYIESLRSFTKSGEKGTPPKPIKKAAEFWI
tara:strand:+ start:6471 stop:7514 length:1044 start_codon:yes stop_codon:yes gene_type:complete